MTHKIGAVASMTGLSTHVIRIWERRYGAVEPVRTPGGDRSYSDADIDKLRRLKLLVERGHGIRDVATLTSEALEELLRRHPPVATATGSPEPSLVEGLLATLQALDVHSLSRELERQRQLRSSRAFILDIGIPFLEGMGSAWAKGRISAHHEHVGSALVRRLLDRIQSANVSSDDAPVALATTPTGELHELGALAALALATTHGYSTVYLGPSLPPFEIRNAAEGLSADLVLISALNPATDAIRELQSLLPARATLIAGSPGTSGLEPFPQGPRVESLDQLNQVLAGLRNGL